MAGNRARNFDREAGSFDRRAGLPARAQQAIAIGLTRIASLGPSDLLLEIGAGTGQIGRALCALPVRYLGIDLSYPMLKEFASHRRRDGSSRPIAVADAVRRWPLRDGIATMVFGSRSLHLLPLPHLIQETLRVATPTRSYAVLGWVARDSNGIRATIRRQMHEALAGRGYAPNDAPVYARRLIDAFVYIGAREVSPQVAAAWTVRRSARQMIEHWRAVDGLAGLDLSPEDKETVLVELTEWVMRKFGSLEVAEISEEKYLLAGVQLPPRVSGAAL